MIDFQYFYEESVIQTTIFEKFIHLCILYEIAEILGAKTISSTYPISIIITAMCNQLHELNFPQNEFHFMEIKMIALLTKRRGKS